MKLIPGTPISIRTSEGKFAHCIVVGEEFQQWNVAPQPVVLPLEEHDDGPLIRKLDAEKPVYVSRWAQTRGVSLEYVQQHALTFPSTSLGFVYYICFKGQDTSKPIFLPYNTVSGSYNKSKVVREWADQQIRALTGAVLPESEPQGEDNASGSQGDNTEEQ